MSLEFNAKGYPDFEDLVLFDRVAEELTNRPSISLNDVAKSIGKAASVISACTNRLEGFAKQELVARHRGGSVLTSAGAKFHAECRHLLGRFQNWQGGRRHIVVGCTPNIKSSVLVGAVAAHMLRDEKRRTTSQRLAAFGAHEYPLEIDVVPMDTPELLRAVRSGTAKIGIGWDLNENLDAAKAGQLGRRRAGAASEKNLGAEDIEVEDALDPYPDLEFDPLIQEKLAYVVFIPDPHILDSVGDKQLLQELWRPAAARKDIWVKKKTWPEKTHGALKGNVGITSLSELTRALQNKRIAAAKTEISRLRNDLLSVADVSRIVWADNTEAVLACVRMYTADFGWGPEPYRRREHIGKLFVVDDRQGEAPADEDKWEFKHVLGRNVMLYLRKDPLHDKVQTQEAQYDEFISTLKKFASDNLPAILGATLSPKEIAEWVEENPLPVETDSPPAKSVRRRR